MAEFALICEGITDQVIITDILCGFFDDEGLDGDIVPLQPPYDATTQKQKEFGGWRGLLKYLQLSRFRDAVLNNRYVIIQLDSDISYKEGFVKHTDKKNQELSVKSLVDKFIDELIEAINKNESGFYQTYKERIIFCICVHSIECWLLLHYRSQSPKKPKIKGCESELQRVLGQKYGKKCEKAFDKNYHYYRRLSEPFLEHKNLEALALKEPSFTIFWSYLESVFSSNPDLKKFLLESGGTTFEGIDLARDESSGRDIDL